MSEQNVNNNLISGEQREEVKQQTRVSVAGKGKTEIANGYLKIVDGMDPDQYKLALAKIKSMTAKVDKPLDQVELLIDIEDGSFAQRIISSLGYSTVEVEMFDEPGKTVSVEILRSIISKSLADFLSNNEKASNLATADFTKLVKKAEQDGADDAKEAARRMLIEDNDWNQADDNGNSINQTVVADFYMLELPDKTKVYIPVAAAKQSSMKTQYIIESNGTYKLYVKFAIKKETFASIKTTQKGRRSDFRAPQAMVISPDKAIIKDCTSCYELSATITPASLSIRTLEQWDYLADFCQAVKTIMVTDFCDQIRKEHDGKVPASIALAILRNINRGYNERVFDDVYEEQRLDAVTEAGLKARQDCRKVFLRNLRQIGTDAQNMETIEFGLIPRQLVINPDVIWTSEKRKVKQFSHGSCSHYSAKDVDFGYGKIPTTKKVVEKHYDMIMKLNMACMMFVEAAAREQIGLDYPEGMLWDLGDIDEYIASTEDQYQDDYRVMFGMTHTEFSALMADYQTEVRRIATTICKRQAQDALVQARENFGGR